MEKVVGVLVGEKIFQWQIETLEKLKDSGLKIELLSVNQKERHLNYYLKLLFFLESKILKSNFKYLKSRQVQEQIFSVNFLGNISSALSNSQKFSYIISFLQQQESEIKEISISSNIPVISLSAPAFPGQSLIDAISNAYKKGEILFEINLQVYKDGAKSLKYSAVSSIEAGLLLKSINAILAKCSLIIPRFFNNNCNVFNIEVSRDINIRLDKKRGLLNAFFIHLFDKIYYKRQWILLYNFTHAQNQNPVNSFCQLLPAKINQYADPFVITHEGRQYLFLEELGFKNGKGIISYSTIGGNRISTPKKIIESKYHMSFPNVFKYNNQFYMIPETQDDNNIQLWRCMDFPEKWKKEKNIVDNVKAVDSIIHEINGKWWLFCSIKSLREASGHEELHIFYSDSPLSDKWLPHSGNPVISDARCGRNAGKIEYKNGKYFRYSQFSGKVYGFGISKSEIVKISENEYKEKLMEIIYPDNSKGFYNLHSFNYDGNLVVSDAIRRIKRFL
ncbi:MAG: hypothetical protein JST62_13025 [Bacteroidetes bacterium]|nr:hypothetical protein [Bacteroidota bacterium]